MPLALNLMRETAPTGPQIATPNSFCPVCRTVQPHMVIHHDHFRDLVFQIAADYSEEFNERNVYDTLAPDPATFPDTQICNACNGLCSKFKTARKNASSFMSLSPEDMRLYLDGMDTHDLLDRVENRYREPFRYWMNRLDAKDAFVRAYHNGKDQGKASRRQKPERTRVLATLDTHDALREAFDARDVGMCFHLAHDLVKEKTWGKDELHSFVHHLWFSKHGGPTNSGVFARAFKSGNLDFAERVFGRGVDYEW